MLITPRLLLRPWRKTDLTAMAAINANPEVMRYFPATQTALETKGFISRNQIMQQERGYCYFAAELLETEQLIGFIGLAYQDYAADFTPCVDIGWRLTPTAWGKGLATEGAKACLEFSFSDLGLKEVVAVTVRANTPSIKVMERIGMQYRSTFRHPALLEYPQLAECVVYEVVK